MSALGADPEPASSEPAWPVVGRQGLIRIVIVPLAEAADRAAYARQVTRLCPPDETCFLNFFTNSTGATPEVPLPDAIAHEATAIFRRSLKQGAELFRLSCRLGGNDANCF